jgi:hypothetical protein
LLVEFSNSLTTYERMGDLTRNQAERLSNESQTRIQHLLSLPELFVSALREQLA